MKKIGLQYPVVALYDDSTGTPVYTGGVVMGKAMKAGIKWTKNDAKLYADDGIDDIDQSINGGTESLALNELTHQIQSLILGHKIGENGEMVVNQSDISPYVGHGFFGKVKRSGTYKYRAVWFPKMLYGEPDDETETQGEKPNFQTPSIDGTIMKDINGDYKKESLFDNEADAIAWLNAKAGIPVSASGGLTALSMTGTGGTLSPAFATGTRYYTFGGVTGASVTVTATAANHTILLYADGALLQTLVSGTASATIPMSVGTKKLTIVAQENGKQSQTTEIIVVKVS